MEKTISNNEIYYLFACPRMFYFHMKDKNSSQIVENALEQDRLKNLVTYFSNTEWCDAANDPEKTARYLRKRENILQPKLEGTYGNYRFSVHIHGLIRQKGTYHMIISHLSRNPGKRHRSLASLFYRMLRKKGIEVSKNVLFVRKDNLKTVRISPDSAEDLLNNIDGINDAEKPPPPQGHRICNFCIYWDKCHHRQNQHREEMTVDHLRGAGKGVRRQLGKIGVETLEDLLNLKLTDEMRRSIKNIDSLKLQSYAYVEDKAIFLKPPEELLDKERGVYFDIEADDTPYLFGFLENDRYKYFLLDDEQSREKNIGEILGFVDSIEGRLYHYCEYEYRVLSQLSHEIDTHFQRKKMLDVYEIVKNNIVTPLRHYSLKSIAKWIGFRWRIGLDGRSSIQEYRRWKKTGNKKHLQALLLYNEDDCRATKSVKEWISDPGSFSKSYTVMDRREVNDILG